MRAEPTVVAASNVNIFLFAVHDFFPQDFMHLVLRLAGRSAVILHAGLLLIDADLAARFGLGIVIAPTNASQR
jgi:hypothetical protein